MKKYFLTVLIACLVYSVGINAQDATKRTLGSKKKTITEKATTETKTDKKTLPNSKSGKEEIKSAIPDNAIVGTVVCLNDLVMGKSETSAGDAKKMYNSAQPLLFKDIKGSVYVVYNTDGSFAAKKLSAYAGDKLGISGKVKIIKGVKVLIAERFYKG